MICEILNPCNSQLIIKNYSIIMNTYINSVKKNKQNKNKNKNNSIKLSCRDLNQDL